MVIYLNFVIYTYPIDGNVQVLESSDYLL